MNSIIDLLSTYTASKGEFGPVQGVFVSKQIVTKFIKEKAETDGVDTRFRDENLEKLITDYHPDKKAKCIEYLKIKYGDKFDLVLYFKDADKLCEQSISYVSCIQCLFKKYDKSKTHCQNVNSAFREAIKDKGRETYRRSRGWICDWDFACDICRIRENVHVDHKSTAFCDIVASFLEKINKSAAQIELKSCKYAQLMDDDVTKQWIAHHDAVADYQLLCKSCNSTKGRREQPKLD